MRITVASVLALVAFAPLHAQAAAIVSPAAFSDEILAAHPGTSGGLRARYQQDTDGRNSAPLSVTLARDYDVFETSTQRTIYDYKLRRVLHFQPAFIATYASDSLYADIWRRAAEVQRRSNEAGPVAQAGLSAVKGQLSLAPFWAESELGIIAPSYPRPLALKRSEGAGRTSWSLDGQEVVAVRWHGEAVPDDVKKNLRRLWLRLAPVHPAIADELAASGRLPEELWVQGVGADHRRLVRMHWKLLGSEWAAGIAYPLPPHLRAGPTETAGAFPEIFATLSKDVEQRLRPPPENAYLEKMQTAITEGDGLQALVWQMEMRLAAGGPAPDCTTSDRRPACTLGQVASSLAQNDERTSIAFASTSPSLRQRATFLDLPNGYLLRLLWATRPPGDKVTFAESERGVLDALKASPVANFSKEAGDFYASAWKPNAAWQVWDFGRLMAGHRPGDLLQEVDTLEDRLLRSYPELF